MRHATLCKAVAVITLVSAAVQARALIIVPLFERGGIGTQFVLMVLVILALAMASIAGLWRPRWWGFVAFYGSAITSTLLLGSALIPFVIGLVPTDSRVEGVIALNGAVLLGVALLHWRHTTRPIGNP